MRIGLGTDVHQFVDGRKLILGGVEIPYKKGLKGHSDADVLIHAIMDSILGPLELGDIGHLFPDADEKYKDIDSLLLLKKVKQKMEEKSIYIVNIDCVVMAQSPKLADYIFSMREKISNILQIDMSCITIKATTTENLGFIGRKEGIACQAVTLLDCH